VKRGLPAEQAVNRLENHLGAGAHANVIGQVHPANRPAGVHQEFGGAGDVLALFTALGVQNPVAADRFRLRIGQERKSKLLGMDEFERFVRRIDADDGDGYAALAELTDVLLESP